MSPLRIYFWGGGPSASDSAFRFLASSALRASMVASAEEAETRQRGFVLSLEPLRCERLTSHGRRCCRGETGAEVSQWIYPMDTG